MADEVKVILDLSEDVQTLLEQQGVDLYEELQRDIPSLRIVHESDPAAPKGSRDIVPVLYGVAAVITALTPTILGILKQITPPNRSDDYTIEEIETRQPDGTVIIQRRRIHASSEQRPWAALETSQNQLPSSSKGVSPSQTEQNNQP